MTAAVRLAARGTNACEPNPRVGCVIANAAGAVLGEGWHAQAGEGHAEVRAIAAARAAGHDDALAGATAYVTLEPCAHFGRTPPCSQALLAVGIGRVVVAVEDPNPQVDGTGIQQLRAAGVEVEVGLMADQARQVARGFLSRLERGRPFVTVKVATSLDGATAMRSGESRWISGAASRRDVHRCRANVGAILTGVGTVVADDPSFTVREATPTPPWRHPLRVVVDPQLRTPPRATLLNDGGQTLLIHDTDIAEDARAAFGEREGVELHAVPANADGSGLNLSAVLDELAERGVNELMVEAGARLNGSLLGSDLVDEVLLYVAPHLMGTQTLGAWSVPGLARMDQRISLQWQHVERIGDDLRIVATPQRRQANDD
ncbi:MAG: bifunctional diaminohydroxyphosphoribosylaminopyrimidine deaminase/5-amino-6-(5-phosphoribosylamino)uracil reductase RibD [Pseudomonadota bacterium]